MKKLSLVLCLVFVLPVFSSCISYDENIDNFYDSVEKYLAEDFMPDLDAIDEYKNIEYYSRKDETIFPEYSIQLVVEYDEDAYEREKARLEGAYTYVDQPQIADFDDAFYTLPAEAFSAYGFDFKVAQFEDTRFPKNFGMVGLSDDDCKIAYLWVYAYDLDYICSAIEDKQDAMKNFVAYHFDLD